MKELLEKLSSYNIFNYLLPGTVFVVLLERISNHNLLQKDILVGVFLYYFIGLVISRIGSVIIEPFLKWIGFLKFTEYPKFIAASKIDTKIDLFNEVNNMYRTIVSLFFALGLVMIYDAYLLNISFFKEYIKAIFFVLSLLLFVFSYRKQTNYIIKRVESTNIDK
ncbi:MAG: hypothetical protein ABFS12_03730 [Bacteroidota bacterium]